MNEVVVKFTNETEERFNGADVNFGIMDGFVAVRISDHETIMFNCDEVFSAKLTRGQVETV